MRNQATITHQDYRSTAKHALGCKRCEHIAERLVHETNPNERYALMSQIEWHERLADGKTQHS